MKEYKIGEKFSLIVERRTSKNTIQRNKCINCFFYNIGVEGGNNNCYRLCSTQSRMDEENIIFIEKIK